MALLQPNTPAWERYGLTRRIEVEGGDYVLDLMVSPTADLDGTFRAYDLDEGDFITVHGWLFVVTNEEAA